MKCCETLALLHSATSPAIAAQLFGVAISLRRHTGAATDVVEVHPEAAALRAACREAFQEGEDVHPEDAAAFAISAAGELHFPARSTST